MIPSVLASQFEQGLKDYIDTTFPITNSVFANSMKNFLNNVGSIFRDPYIAVRLPFRTATDFENHFQGIKLGFTPYVHQIQAFERLIDTLPKSTLVATGTGSGKTECFLYPILEYCYRHRGEKGIKAIIIYPMNALATDQSGRLADEINKTPQLFGNITAGMYLGDKEEHPSGIMSARKIITDRDVLRQSPPDILLTNYKMLDYLLVRPGDAGLWTQNGSETLKFIVVDEIHTFDGAQGTDLACLIRRLKSRLFTPQNYLCCIGTSATMGSEVNREALINYATNIFGEQFDENSLICEDRLSAADFLAGAEIIYRDIPDRVSTLELYKMTTLEADHSVYIKKAYNIWFGEIGEINSIALSQKLKQTQFFSDLLFALGGKMVDFGVIIQSLVSKYPLFIDKDYAKAVIDSIIALISYARSKDENNIIPFLQVHEQLWFRELRRMVAQVSDDNPQIAISDDINKEQTSKYLPIINCRDCGATGWVSLKNENGCIALSDLRIFYSAFFSQDKKVVMLFPEKEERNVSESVKLCSKCLYITLGEMAKSCCNCGNKDLVAAYMPILETIKKSYVCPYCGSTGGLSLIGSQSATLISSGVSQLFSSRYNDDKKLLAFSDSVQDASHRASFINARTWRFNLRTAIQHYVKNGGSGLPVSEFIKGFSDYWLSIVSPEDFVATFIPTNLTWRKPYEDLLKTGIFDIRKEENKKLLGEIKNRLEIEILYEYGFNARIGRTLEKSGASCLTWDIKTINSAADMLLLRVQNEIGELRNLEKKNAIQLILSLLLRMKNNGAIYHNVFNDYIYHNGETYHLSADKIRWMPGIAKSFKAPHFLIKYRTRHTRETFDVIGTNKWFNDYVARSVDLPLMRNDLPQELFAITISELENCGIFSSHDTKSDQKAWGIDIEAASISGDSYQLSCEHCGHMLSISSDLADIAGDMPCQRKGCSGNYIILRADMDFYGNQYSRGDVCRIFAKEHTGLIDRENRENVEISFKKKRDVRKVWDTNLLSCTPTLEMGIDIGDLSTVVLCSVPPTTAQYLQRIGRAGRQDGNALSVVVVNAKPHDLYFFEDPLEMVSGDINTPAIFLNASAVLARQFTAFCFDSWVKSGVNVAAIPKNIGAMLTSIASDRIDKFPNNLLFYIETNLSQLINGFISMFNDYLGEDSKERLINFAKGSKLDVSSLTYKIKEAFGEIYSERETLKDYIKNLNKQISKLENGVHDSSYESEKEALIKEREAFKEIIKNINEKNTFNFLSDEGLLPNYAFPEAGITLKSIIYRNTKKDDETAAKLGKKYENYVYEYKRPPVSAIREFAPENSFYAGGHKMTIDQIDVKLSPVELWRLCPSCSHIEIIKTGENEAYCPHCKDPLWADSGQKRNMLKMKMVYSTSEYTGSFIGDESDDRDVKFFSDQVLVDVDEEHITDAYKIDNERNPFGFEYISKAELREINFGQLDTVGEKVTVSGKEEIRRGFRICKHCGKIQKRSENAKPEHSFSCEVRNSLKSEDYEDCIFLYREFSTEAIRLLVPASSIESSEARLQTFIAAVMLGLKKHFGSVDHIKSCLCEEPAPELSIRKNYLVLYDAVPGGTGYLKQLASDPNMMIAVFQAALDEMKGCACNKTDKDGCYRCLFAYKQSRYIGSISRNLAIEMVSEILRNKDKLIKIKTINDIHIGSMIESELEKRFIEALAQCSKENMPIDVSYQIVNNKPGYALTVGDSEWVIEPQVELIPAGGMQFLTRADFVISPKIKNTKIEIKPIAVYCDGYAFHKDQIGIDIAKRMAIVKSGTHLVWSLSYKDVENVFHNQGDYYTDIIKRGTLANWDNRNIVFRITGTIDEEFEHYLKLNSIQLLLEYLNAPNIEYFKSNASALGGLMIDLKKFNDRAAYDAWFNLCKTFILNEEMYSFETCSFGEISDDASLLHFGCGITLDQVKSGKFNDAFLYSILEDQDEMRGQSYESNWNGFLRMYNILQFLPSSIFVTQAGLSEGIYDNIINADYYEVKINTSDLCSDDIGKKWHAIIELVDESVVVLCRALAIEKVILPSEPGFEIVDDQGAVIGEVELAWEKQKIGIAATHQTEYIENLTQMGWHIFNCNSNANDIIDILLKKDGREK
jgi:DEAD/DEAH box helicase domain-containing protein